MKMKSILVALGALVLTGILNMTAHADPYNNSIEFRCDSSGSEYFRFRYREVFEEEPYAFFLQSPDPDVWTVNAHWGWNGVIWGIRAEYTESDGSVPGLDHTIFNNKNVSSEMRFAPYLYETATREMEGCNVSKTFGNHQQDWDFVVARKDSLLAANGLTDQSSDWDKAAIMAYHCYWMRANLPDPPEGGGYWVHPVDFLIHKAFCQGAGNAFVALCSVMGIPARTCMVPGHTISEAFIDGRWRLAENTPSMIEGIAENPAYVHKGPLFPFSLADMLVDPQKYGFDSKSYYTDGLANGSAVQYQVDTGPRWRFFLNSNYDSYDGAEVRFSLLSMQEINLLYSGNVSVYRGWEQGTAMWLVPPMHAVRVWKGWASYRVEQGNGIRQHFYLSDAEDLTEVKSYIVIDTADECNMPADGGDWYYSVNGHTYYLRDHGGWSLQPHPYTADIKCLEFSIPLDALETSPTVSSRPGEPEKNLNVSSKFAAHVSGQAVTVRTPFDGAYEIVIRSLDGKVRMQTHAKGASVSFPRSSFASGAYAVSLRNNHATYNLRFCLP